MMMLPPNLVNIFSSSQYKMYAWLPDDTVRPTYRPRESFLPHHHDVKNVSFVRWCFRTIQAEPSVVLHILMFDFEWLSVMCKLYPSFVRWIRSIRFNSIRCSLVEGVKSISNGDLERDLAISRSDLVETNPR